MELLLLRRKRGDMKRPVILIVEDDAEDRYLLQNAFEQIGVTDTVQTVGDGQEAVEYLSGKGPFADRHKFRFPTLLLLDLKMPRMNGLEFLSYVKHNPSLRVIPTIVFTSSDHREDIRNAYQLGANSYIVKGKTFEMVCGQLKFIYGYWMRVEVPPVDQQGHLPPMPDVGEPFEKLA